MHKAKQVGIAELQTAIQNVLNGGDPLDFVNTFMKRPIDAPPFPRDYWEQRICAVAEILEEIGQKSKKQESSNS